MGQEQKYGSPQVSGDRKSNAGTSGSDVKQNPDNPYAKANPSTKEATMNPQLNQEQTKDDAPQLKAKLKQNFGRLSDDEIALYDNQKEQFFSKLQHKYGLERQEAEERIQEIEDDQKAA